MTEPMNDFERRLTDELRAWTEDAPRHADFAEDARLLAEYRPLPRRRWLAPLLGLSTAAAAVAITLAIISLVPLTPRPAASGSPSASAESTPPASADASGTGTPSPTMGASPGVADWSVTVLAQQDSLGDRAEDVYVHERLGVMIVGWTAGGGMG